MKVLLDIPHHIMLVVDKAVAENKINRSKPRQLLQGHIDEAERLRLREGPGAAEQYLHSVTKVPDPIYRTTLIAQILERGFGGWEPPTTPDVVPEPQTKAERMRDQRAKAAARMK